jgi:hypothetical protein
MSIPLLFLGGIETHGTLVNRKWFSFILLVGLVHKMNN